MADIKPPTIDEIEEQIRSIPDGKAAGETGMLPVHLKYLIDEKKFARIL